MLQLRIKKLIYATDVTTAQTKTNLPECCHNSSHVSRASFGRYVGFEWVLSAASLIMPGRRLSAAHARSRPFEETERRFPVCIESAAHRPQDGGDGGGGDDGDGGDGEERQSSAQQQSAPSWARN